jgi:hypothetical protein
MRAIQVSAVAKLNESTQAQTSHQHQASLNRVFFLVPIHLILKTVQKNFISTKLSLLLRNSYHLSLR